MQKDSVDYFLFPCLALPEKDFRNLFVFLPRLSIIEISRQAVLPEWSRERFSGLPAITSPEFMGQVKACIQGYRAFAEVHGASGGTLGYLSQALDDMSESRFKIQEELRGKYPSGLDAERTHVLRSAVFLDIARELDEKELELESGLTRAGALEKEFSEILGITEEIDALEMPETLDLPLIAESSGPLYMLPERIESWFRLYSTRVPESMPVFAATCPEAVAEALYMLRTGCARAGKEFASSTFSLGSFPRLDQLGHKQFRSLIEAPGAPALLAAYQEQLDLFLLRTAGGIDPDSLEVEAASLRQSLENFCAMCRIPGPDRVNLSLELPRGLFLDEALGILSAGGGRAPTIERPEARKWPALFLSLD